MAAGIGLMMGAEMVTYYLSDKILAYLPFGCWNFSTYLFSFLSIIQKNTEMGYLSSFYFVEKNEMCN